MKRILLIAACGLLTLAQAVAQPGGGMFFGRRIERDAALVAEYSEFMAEKYKLNEDQAAKVRDLILMPHTWARFHTPFPVPSGTK